MSVNKCGLRGAVRMKRALAFSRGKIRVNMDNNVVLAEVLNSVTHGIGVLCTMLAWTYMSERARAGGTWTHEWSSTVYMGSLLTMYTASTLYHSFYFTTNPKAIFHTLDRCAIYILIAGTYTPVLAVSLNGNPVFETYLLGLMWVICLGGIFITGFEPPLRRLYVWGIVG